MSCSFCEIIRTSKQVIYRDDLVVALLDIDPISKGHLLICPVQHYVDLDELPEALLGHLFKLAGVCVRTLKSKYAPMGYSIMQNGGAFNDIGHFHVHVFPRYDKATFGWQYAEAVPRAAFDFERVKAELMATLDLHINRPDFGP